MEKIKIASVLNPKGDFWVIGDIHGCYKELNVLLNEMLICGFGSDDVAIFLGDYIDRGPDSKKTVQMVINFQISYPNTLCLRGNHEDMLLDFLGLGGNHGMWFTHNGGTKTCDDYGIRRNISSNMYYDVLRNRKNAIGTIGSEHMAFFLDLLHAVDAPNHFFVHAGVDPRKSLNDQAVQDLLWIRDWYYYLDDYPFPKVIVHGHTPHCEGAPLFYEDKCVNLDGACVYGTNKIRGDLICMRVNSRDILESDYIAVRKASREVVKTL